jgi:hypothetical protein
MPKQAKMVLLPYLQDFTNNSIGLGLLIELIGDITPTMLASIVSELHWWKI